MSHEVQDLSLSKLYSEELVLFSKEGGWEEEGEKKQGGGRGREGDRRGRLEEKKPPPNCNVQVHLLRFSSTEAQPHSHGRRAEHRGGHTPATKCLQTCCSEENKRNRATSGFPNLVIFFFLSMRKLIFA